MDTEALNISLSEQVSLKRSGGPFRLLEENFVWIAILLSILLHFGTVWVLMRDEAVIAPPVAAPKPATRVRIFANPNGNPNSKAKAVEIAKPKPQPKPKPKADTRAIVSKPVEQVQEQAVVAEASGPQSFGDDTTGGVVGEGFSTTDGESDPGVTSNAEPVERINPNFPTEARMKGIEGWVLLRFDINEEGRIENVEVVKAEPRNVFEKEARAAVRKWRYAPSMVNGVASKVIGREVRLEFKLDS